jgi:hypothetical protein
MSAYLSIIEVLADVVDDPEAAAIEILDALGPMPNEVAQAGVDQREWDKASAAMIAIGKHAQTARRAKEADIRRRDWPQMREQLEGSGCHVTKRQGETWRVVGTGVSIDIDLSTGEMEHSEGELGEQLPEFERIADYIVRSVASREAHLADLARRAERRKSHEWHNKKKVWLPRSGVGPIIRAGE